ncbi:uncharacterized protein LOC131220047 [Magnolia sinica]|uniref:uncharacterized protein LOC131220047 n=1 Tax=Magnolia sinica TaxID=86752 RepID=UPI002658510D|nr:uncharacterized protein LOC131220047 [Magnolia sinica]
MREGKRIFITTNNLGQLVNENVSKLTNFLGTTARNGDYVPLTYSNWRAVPNEKKDDMYELIMSDKEIKSWVLMSIGKKWRDYKCELKKFHYLPYDNDEARLTDLNEHVHMDQWKALIEFWNSEEGKEQLNDRTSQQPEATQNSTVRNDIFSKVMGDERHGRLCTYGLGPSPSDIWGTTSHIVQSQGMAFNAQKRDEQYEGLHSEISSLRETMADRDAQISSLRETMATFMATIMNPSINLTILLGISTNPNLNQPSSSSSHLVPTPLRDLANKGNSTSCTNVTQVLIKSIVRPGDIVAIGTVLSMDPLTKVGGQKLGVGFWEVFVQVAMKKLDSIIPSKNWPAPPSQISSKKVLGSGLKGDLNIERVKETKKHLRCIRESTMKTTNWSLGKKEPPGSELNQLISLLEAWAAISRN